MPDHQKRAALLRFLQLQWHLCAKASVLFFAGPQQACQNLCKLIVAINYRIRIVFVEGEVSYERIFIILKIRLPGSHNQGYTRV